MVSVHSDVGTVLQEERRFGAGSHLRTMGAAITPKGRTELIVRGHGNDRLSRYTARVFAVTIGSQGYKKRQRNEAANETRPLARTTARRLSWRRHGGTTGAKQRLRPLLPGGVGLDFKRDSFADGGTTAIPWKGRDMNKDLGAAVTRSDEPETSFIIPLGERAFDAHTKRADVDLGKWVGTIQVLPLAASGKP